MTDLFVSEEFKKLLYPIVTKLEDLKNELNSKNKTIAELNEKVSLLSSEEENKSLSSLSLIHVHYMNELHALNKVVNKLRQENEELKKKVNSFTKSNSPLKGQQKLIFPSSKTTNLKETPSRRKILPETQHRQHKKIKTEVKEEEEEINIQCSSPSSDFGSSQVMEDTIPKSPQQDRGPFDFRLTYNDLGTMEDSIDLATGDIALSSPIKNRYTQSPRKSQSLSKGQKSSIASPKKVKVKLENEPKIKLENETNGFAGQVIEDSEEEMVLSYQPHKAVVKKEQKDTRAIPKLQYQPRTKQNKVNILQKKSVHSRNQRKIISKFDFTELLNNGECIDLSINPEYNRPWIIEDFKPNSILNNNMDYAYQQILRGNAKKACIHGKGCPNCETFYRLAGPGKVTKGLEWDSSHKHKSGVVDNVSKVASRHKDYWERPPSPPGFNNAEFPTTQENKENNLKSEQLIREKTTLRLIDALNGGKFIFRNEIFNDFVRAKRFRCDKIVSLPD